MRVDVGLRAARTAALLCGIAAAVAVGCGTAPAVRDDLPPGVQLEGLDDRAVLERASAAYDAGRYDEALAWYDLLVDAFPASSLRPLAVYNGALALEATQRYEAALERFRAFLAIAPRPRDAVDARFHSGACLESLRRWDEAAAEFSALLDGPLPPADRLEAGARAGWALVNAGDFGRAERLLEGALATWRGDEQLRAVPTRSWAALASFALGEIDRHLAARVPLRPPQEQLTRDLRDKADLFVRAEDRYLETLPFQHPTWSVAAGYRLGRLYEQLHADLLAAELPPELVTVAQREEYVDALRGRVIQLVEKAHIAYERTVQLSERMGVADDEWGRRAARRLVRLDALLREERRATAE